MVETREKRARPIERRRLEVFHAPDRRPGVRMIGGIHRAKQLERCQPVGPVLVALPPLVQHDAALGLEARLGQRGDHPAHAIGFHPERQPHRFGRHGLPVVRPIGARRPVDRRTRSLQGLEVAVRLVRRPFEHQVFEQMRETRLAGLLVPRADVIPDIDRDERHAPVLVDDDVETVRQRRLSERQVHRGKLEIWKFRNLEI